MKKGGCKIASRYDCTSMKLPIYEPTYLDVDPGIERISRWLPVI